ncbi:16564_t:CDS:2 [Acaulospora morrowiae]|uniref:16564_t:CDS:1 n=1 Tax=Acaulospora morrowiae TaxID=94023 RepID=A0A9N9ALY0_9GLOM|nr:16564_t:CDS:2 [Acaulospora morrowiae]
MATLWNERSNTSYCYRYRYTIPRSPTSKAMSSTTSPSATEVSTSPSATEVSIPSATEVSISPSGPVRDINWYRQLWWNTGNFHPKAKWNENPNTELSNYEFIDDSSDILTEAEACEEIKTIKTLSETEGEWESGNYVNTKTYRLICWENKYQNPIQIVTVKA